MNLTLKPELAEFIQQEILMGKYVSPDEVIEASLHLLKSKNATDRLARELRAKHEATFIGANILVLVFVQVNRL